MKKIFFSILLFASFSYSHSQILSTELSKDEIFVSYVNHFDQLIDHLSSHFTKPALQLLKNDIENSRANNLSQSEEVSLISGLIKFDDPTQLGLLISSIRKSHYELTKSMVKSIRIFLFLRIMI
ncbi:MAG: hypothetical protein IPP48_16540 [Chitinophagaceae bacterium]|nr:hypothetical protein [Chitinophagaceae bacterium]